MCKCEIQWIDEKGQPTPDNNEAIGLAVCYDPLTFGEKGSKAFPICEAHAKIRGKFWKLLPFEELKNTMFNNHLVWHDMVFHDHQYFKVIPDVVINSIKNSFPNDYESILNDLKYNRDHFYFERFGIYIGIEESDGYLHS